jgi:hypothetical protein
MNKMLFKPGEHIKVTAPQIRKGDLKDRKIIGRITGIFEYFIVVDTGRYKEAFSYVDMMIGEVKILR